MYKKINPNIFFRLIFILIIQLSAENVSGQQGKDLLRKIEGPRAKKKSSFIVELSIQTEENGQKIQSAKYKVYYKGHQKSLIKQLEPKFSRGNLILMLKENMWFFKKGNRKPLRITPMQRLLGGASNADIAKFSFSNDYDVVSVTDTLIKQKKLYKLMLKAKFSYLPYPRIELLVYKSNYHLYQGFFYSLSGQLLKVAYYENYRKFDSNIEIPSVIRISDRMFGKNKETIIRYHSVRPHRIPNKYFNFDYLEHFSG
jgi:hypothetical protein